MDIPEEGFRSIGQDCNHPSQTNRGVNWKIEWIEKNRRAWSRRYKCYCRRGTGKQNVIQKWNTSYRKLVTRRVIVRDVKLERIADMK